MKVHLVKRDGKFYITNNPNKLGCEVILECSRDNQNDWGFEILKYGDNCRFQK